MENQSDEMMMPQVSRYGDGDKLLAPLGLGTSMTRSFSNGGATVDVAFDQKPVYAGHALTGTVTLTTGRSELAGGAIDLVFTAQEQAEWKQKSRGYNLQPYEYTVNLASSPNPAMPVIAPAGHTFVYPFSFPVPKDALPSYNHDNTRMGKHGQSFRCRHVATVVLTSHSVADLHEPVKAEFDFVVGVAIPRQLQERRFEPRPHSATMAPCHDIWTSCPAQLLCCCCFYPCCCLCSEDVTITTRFGQRLPISFDVVSAKKLVRASYHLHSTLSLDSARFVHTLITDEIIITEQPILFSSETVGNNHSRYDAVVNECESFVWLTPKVARDAAVKACTASGPRSCPSQLMGLDVEQTLRALAHQTASRRC